MITRQLQIEGEAARALLANIRDVIGDDEEMIETAVEGQTNLKEVISGAVDGIQELRIMIGLIHTLRSELEARGARFANQVDRIETAIHVAMGQAQLRKLVLPQATLSLRAVAPKTEITDEAAIPVKFWKERDPVLDRKAVLDALKIGEVVPGATLSNGGETISIRVK